MSRVLYPIHVEPVSTQPETVTESRWHQPYSEPRRDRIAKAFAVALIASGAVIGPRVLTQPEDIKWHQRLSEPVSVKQLAVAQQQSIAFVPTVTPAPTSISFAQTSTLVPYQVITLYQSIADPVTVTTTPETITVDKWFARLSEPVRIKPTPRPDLSLVVAHAEPNTPWIPPLSEPVRSNGISTALQSTTALTQAFPFHVPSVDEWGQQFSIPTQRNIVTEGAIARVPFIPSAETVTADKWFSELSEPTRLNGLAASQQQTIAFVPTVTTPSVDVLLAHTSTLVPYRVTFLYQSIASPVAITSAAPETITVDKWLHQWVNPVRKKAGLPAYQQQFLAFTKAAPFPENVTWDRWGQPLDTPSIRLSLHASQQQAVAFTAPAPTVEIVTLDKWFNQLSGPVRAKFIQHLAPSLVISQPEPTTSWFSPFGEPQRKKPSVAAQQDIAFVKADPFPEEVIYAKWGYALSEPVRVKAGLLAANQNAHIEPVVAVQETITVDKWYRELGTPTWLRSYKAALAQFSFQSDYLVPAPYVDPPMATWTYPWSMPVRLRSYGAALAPASFQSNYLVPAPYVDPPMASWTYAWSGPVRLHPGLLAVNQSGAVAPILPQPNPPPAPGVYTVSGLYVIDQFTDNTVVYNYGGGVSHRTN